MRRPVAALLALLTGFGALAVLAAPAAFAACASQVGPGKPLPEPAGQDALIERMGLRRAWELSTGRGITVSVVDSGVDSTQPKLAGAVDPPVDYRTTFTSGSGFESGPGVPGDCVGHGTAIAGLIAARSAGDDRVLGVAPDARVAPFRFESDIGRAPPELIAAAIHDAADHSQVMNLSFAVGTDDAPIRDAVRYALSRDVVVVAAAGNENESDPGVARYPAAYPGVLAVANVDQNGQPTDQSNRGRWVGIAAPGQEITTVASGGGYTTVSGTSFSAAVVSGVAALVRARDRTLNAQQVIARLQSTAVSSTGSRNDMTGAGIVDPFEALSAVGVAPPDPAAPTATSTSVRVLPVPTETPLLTPTGALSLAATAIVLTAAAVAATVGITRRRATARRATGSEDLRYGDAHRPLEPVPELRLD